MPTVLNLAGFRFYFWSKDHEPIHIHAENADGKAKFIIDPEVRLVENNGLKKKQLKKATEVIMENRDVLVSFWKHYFIAQNEKK